MKNQENKITNEIIEQAIEKLADIFLWQIEVEAKKNKKTDETDETRKTENLDG